MYDVVILTDYRYENPKDTNWYIQQVLKEDQLLQEELEKKGLKICKKINFTFNVYVLKGALIFLFIMRGTYYIRHEASMPATSQFIWHMREARLAWRLTQKNE